METLSGGEKMRLSILYTLWDLNKRNKQVLILDEPEQGLDMELVPDIILDIINYNPEMTVFIITHLCDCTVSKLKINNGNFIYTQCAYRITYTYFS